MQIPQDISIVFVGNKYLFDDNIKLIESAIPVFSKIVDGNKKVFLCVQVKNDEEQKMVEDQTIANFPKIKKE